MIDKLGDRMKSFEKASDFSLEPKKPMIIRIDGNAFHTWVKSAGLEKPFDNDFYDCMKELAKFMCNMISGSERAYHFSDEISILVRDDQREETQPWFGKRIQKICSISSSMATQFFNHNMKILKEGKYLPPAYFDSRCFLIPNEEIESYFNWRRKDCIRNSIHSLARSLFSSKQLNSKNSKDMIEMIKSKGSSWESLENRFKFGQEILKKKMVIDTPNGQVERMKFI